MRRIFLTVGAALLILASAWPGLRQSVSTQALSTGFYSVPFTACSPQQNGTGGASTTGWTVVGANTIPVAQLASNAIGTNTHTYVCDVTPPSRLVSGTGLNIVDATFYYGVQTTAIAVPAATLASGVMNASTVWTKVAYPTAATTETASTVAPVRADVGALLITPVVASFNTATTTAGAFFTVKFTPATPIAIADNTKYYLTVALTNQATSATVTNTPGVVVHTQ